jgi:hypothetical protein
VISEGTKVEKPKGTKVEKLEGTKVVTTEKFEAPTASELADEVGLSSAAKAPRVSTNEKITPATMSVEKTYSRKQLTKNSAEHENSDHDESHSSIKQEASPNFLRVGRIFRASSIDHHHWLEAF